MRIYSSDGEKIIQINSSVWLAAVSTVVNCLGKRIKFMPKAKLFIETFDCKPEDGYIIAREINLIRDELSGFSPDKAIADINNKKEKLPWGDNISPVITSCANLFTTDDGKDLFYELVCIFVYSNINNVDIIVE